VKLYWARAAGLAWAGSRRGRPRRGRCGSGGGLEACALAAASLCFQGGFGFPDPLQAAFPPPELFGQLVPRAVRPVAGVLRGIHAFCPLQQHADLLGQAGLLLGHAPIAHGLVLAGVGSDLRPVQRHVPQLDQPRLPSQPQHLVEQLAQGLEVPPAKLAQGPEVGGVARRQHPEGHVFVQPLSDLPGAVHPLAVGVQQHLHHHDRVVGRSPSQLVLVLLLDGMEGKAVHQVTDEVRQVPLRKPLLQGGREEQQLMGMVRPILFGPHTISFAQPGSNPCSARISWTGS
jgi:hypothetical protein